MYIYDAIAVVLIGIAHIFFYIGLIGYERFSRIMIILLGIVLTLLLGIVVTATGYPETNGLLLLLFLLSIGFMKKGLPATKIIYFALVSIVGITFLRSALLEAGFWLFMQSPLNLYLWTGSVIHCITAALLLGGLVLIRRHLRIISLFLTERPIYPITYVLLCIGMVLQFVMTMPASRLLASLNQSYGMASYIASYVLFLVLLLVMMIGFQLSKDRAIQRERQRSDLELLQYVEKLEELHAELAGFRHDYSNILLSLEEGVRNKNMGQIEQVYREVIAPTSTLINHQEMDIVKLARVENAEVKSVLSVKVMTAQQEKLHVEVDIPEVIKTIPIPPIRFIRMISILLDNAIEEAVRSKKKTVQLALFETEGHLWFVVRNSCSERSIQVNRLYEAPFSSKGPKRGVGLQSLKRLIDQSDNAMLETAFEYPYFTQTIKIKKNDRL